VGATLGVDLAPGVAPAGPAVVLLGPAGRLLPLGRRRQALADPAGVRHRLVPADPDDRVVGPAGGVRAVLPPARAGLAGAVDERHDAGPDLLRPDLQVVVAAGADEPGELLVGDGGAVEVEAQDVDRLGRAVAADDRHAALGHHRHLLAQR